MKRTITLTDTGYIAVTESDDPQIAKTLRSHVNQMQDRLDEGLFVRRWDPAYEEWSATTRISTSRRKPRRRVCAS
ncbi:MAG: hypothetical protein HC841_04550 [Verrucomicrobiae bacterium]|nr:hypothetical protein [Verrucomicrobiae bacterium]